MKRIDVSGFPIDVKTIPGGAALLQLKGEAGATEVYLIGDSLINVHFFSGTGVNFGFQTAYVASLHLEGLNQGNTTAAQRVLGYTTS